MAVEGLHVAEIGFPQEIAVQVQAIDAARAEGGDQVLAVGDRRVGGPTAGDVGALVRRLAAHRSLPHDTSIVAADGEHHELEAPQGRDVVVCAGGLAAGGADLFAVGHGGGEKDPVAPDNRGRMPHAG